MYSSGLTIHSTVDSTIQARLEEEYAKEKYKKTSPSKKQTTQSGMAIIDYKTGNVVGRTPLKITAATMISIKAML